MSADAAATVIQVLIGGLARGALYALIASGLTLIFGLTRITNFAHGALVMLGTYVGLTIIGNTSNFFAALLVAPLVLSLVGLVVERSLLKRIYTSPAINQFLLTYGIALIIGQLVLIIWGSQVHVIPLPGILNGQLSLLGVSFQNYEVFVIAVSLAVLLSLYSFLRLTNLGMIVRAAIHNKDMIAAMGVNIELVYVIVFTIGAAFAGLAGILIGPVFSAYVGLGQDIIILGFVVVIIGGLGSLKGALIAAVAVGLGEVISIFLYPSLAGYVIYIALLITLILRPQGLFGSKE